MKPKSVKIGDVIQIGEIIQVLCENGYFATEVKVVRCQECILPSFVCPYCHGAGVAIVKHNKEES